MARNTTQEVGWDVFRLTALMSLGLVVSRDVFISSPGVQTFATLALYMCLLILVFTVIDDLTPFISAAREIVKAGARLPGIPATDIDDAPKLILRVLDRCHEMDDLIFAYKYQVADLLDELERRDHQTTGAMMECNARHFRGITACDILNRRKLCRIKLEDPCIVCREEFEPMQDAAVPWCGHAYHTECLASWVKQNSTCAVCSMEITGGYQVDMYVVSPCGSEPGVHYDLAFRHGRDWHWRACKKVVFNGGSVCREGERRALL